MHDSNELGTGKPWERRDWPRIGHCEDCRTVGFWRGSTDGDAVGGFGDVLIRPTLGDGEHVGEAAQVLVLCLLALLARQFAS